MHLQDIIMETGKMNKNDKIVKRLQRKKRELRKEIKELTIKLDEGWFQGWMDTHNRRTFLGFELNLLQEISKGTTND